jgi:hypothetical protein
MHFIKNLPHRSIVISLYSWNNKYIAKFESDQMEQTYKLDSYEVADLAAFEAMITATFVEKIELRFLDMANDWYS